MDYIVVARLRVSADTPEQAKQRVTDTITAGQMEYASCPNLGYEVQLLAIEPPRAEPACEPGSILGDAKELADLCHRTLMAGFTS